MNQYHYSLDRYYMSDIHSKRKLGLSIGQALSGASGPQSGRMRPLAVSSNDGMSEGQGDK